METSPTRGWDFPPSRWRGPMGVRNWAGSSRSQTQPHGAVSTRIPAGIGMGQAGMELVRREGR